MEFDPHAPFVAQDGLEYDSAFVYLVGNPRETYRNNSITFFRSQGHSEEAVKAWIEGYDAPPEELATLAHGLEEKREEADLRRINAQIFFNNYRLYTSKSL